MRDRIQDSRFRRPVVAAFVAMLLASVTLTALPAAAADVHLYLTARMTGTRTLTDGSTITLWGFRLGSGGGGIPQVPGPVLYANEGDHVFLHFTNMSPMDHTIHLHGLDVDQQNDGVPQTSFSIPMMDSYTYEFTAPHAGSYAYHCHVETLLHLQMGMYGGINILPPDGSNHAWDGGPAFDFERTWITGEVDRLWNQYQTNADFTVYSPDYFMLNGHEGSQIASDPYTPFDIADGETVLLRLGNMGYLPVRYDFTGLWTEVVASDGRPLPETYSANDLMVTPGERYDVLVRGLTAGDFAVNLEYLDLYDGSVLGTATAPVSVTGDPTDVPPEISELGFTVSVATPTPFQDQVSFDFNRLDGSPVEVWIFDTRGRLVRSDRVESNNNGVYQWDGRDNEGQPLSVAVYHLRFRHAGRTVGRTATLLR